MNDTIACCSFEGVDLEALRAGMIRRDLGREVGSKKVGMGGDWEEQWVRREVMVEGERFPSKARRWGGEGRVVRILMS